MLRGAGLGAFIGIFVEGMRDGSLDYEGGGFMIGLGLLFWFYVAKSARDNTANTEAKVEYLEAQIRRARAYDSAFTSAVDAVTRERAHAEALSSPEFRDAREDEELASRIYYATSKAPKGDSE